MDNNEEKKELTEKEKAEQQVANVFYKVKESKKLTKEDLLELNTENYGGITTGAGETEEETEEVKKVGSK